MKMVMKLLILCVLCISAVVILYLAGVFVYSVLTGFYPDPVSESSSYKSGPENINIASELSLMIWNIGYGGLGKEMDHFYEGGEMTRPSENLSQKYISGIKEWISQQDSVDFFILQEVDFNSRRSYCRDQSDLIYQSLKSFSVSSTINYKAGYIPFPLMDPMGWVSSGLVTYSRIFPAESLRISSPGKYSWPKSLFLPRRCLLLCRFKVNNGKELVVINIHNSAYDDASSLRNDELNLLKSQATEEYCKGNYVIVGGDWNQNPPGLDLNKMTKYKIQPVRPINPGFMPAEWYWAYDDRLPTNRNVDQPFVVNKTLCSLIDFFLVSPNIKVLDVKTADAGFEYSDHLPVIFKFQLK